MEVDEKGVSKFWVRTWEMDDGEMKWYCVDLADERGVKRMRTQEAEEAEDITTISPLTKFKSETELSTFVSVGSFLCTVGGREEAPDDYDYGTPPTTYPYRPLHTIHYLDTSHPNLLWKSATMIIPRISPLVTAMDDGRLCIIGGTHHKTMFGEFFDPKSHTNESMPPLPDEFDQIFVKVVFYPKDRRILLFTFQYPLHPLIIYFDLHTHQWDRYDQPPSAAIPIAGGKTWPWLLGDVQDINCALVSTTIYWFSPAYFRIFAYDFVQDQFFQSQSYEFEEDPRLPFPSDMMPSLIHLSYGVFYLVWADYHPHQPYHLLHFTRLLISKSTHQTLSVVVGTMHSYFLEDRGPVPFLDALLL